MYPCSNEIACFFVLIFLLSSQKLSPPLLESYAIEEDDENFFALHKGVIRILYKICPEHIPYPVGHSLRPRKALR